MIGDKTSAARIGSPMPDHDSASRGLLSADRFQRIMILIATGLLVVFLLLIAFIRLGPQIEHHFSSIPFDSESWKRAEDSHDPVRQLMVDDLLAEHELLGRSRAEIDGLLGTPPKTPFFSNYQYVYWLGPERSFIPIDSEWLCIRFENDRVVEVKILND